jgi:hypothetical protein
MTLASTWVGHSRGSLEGILGYPKPTGIRTRRDASSGEKDCRLLRLSRSVRRKPRNRALPSKTSCIDQVVVCRMVIGNLGWS